MGFLNSRKGPFVETATNQQLLASFTLTEAPKWLHEAEPEIVPFMRRLSSHFGGPRQSRVILTKRVSSRHE